jgi:hypothetical protein
MEAYRIDRFGSVDGIVLRSSDDPQPGLREVLMRSLSDRSGPIASSPGYEGAGFVLSQIANCKSCARHPTNKLLDLCDG